MAWHSIGLIGVKIDNVDTSREFDLGTRVSARDTSTGYIGDFIYMKGVASCAAGDWALLNYDNYTVSRLADADVGPVGVAMAATVASTYGWFQTRGKAQANLAASCADNAMLYTTSTAGVADDAASSQYQIMSARAAESVTSAAVGEVEISDPAVGGAAVA